MCAYAWCSLSSLTLSLSEKDKIELGEEEEEEIDKVEFASSSRRIQDDEEKIRLFPLCFLTDVCIYRQRSREKKGMTCSRACRRVSSLPLFQFKNNKKREYTARPPSVRS